MGERTGMAVTGLERRKLELLLEQVDRLPTVPGVAQHLLPRVMAPRPSRREIGQVIESDAALAARVLQLAAAAGHPPDTLRDLDSILDLVPMDELIADLLTIEVADRETLRRGRLTSMWRHNLATAMAAQLIASRSGAVDPAQAQLAGLLHDVGLVAIPLLMPRAFQQVLERVETTGQDVLEAEREVLGIDHVVVGKRLAQQWGFPECLQTVIWLHHQARPMLADRGAPGALADVVHLADLLARREGYWCHPAEQMRDDPAEVALRLGLTEAQVDQIRQQMVEAVPMNAEAVGLNDEPTAGQLWHLVASANARLGSLYRRAADERRRLQAETRRADLLMRMNTRLAACRSPREVLETVAETARDALDVRVVVPYLLGDDLAYVEGVACMRGGPCGDYFLHEIAKGESIETLLADAGMPLGGEAAPSRAERAEAWLFERHDLGQGPFYTMPMVVEGTKVGGIVFGFEDAERSLTRQEATELAGLAGMAGVALKWSNAEAELVALSEELAEVNRELRMAQEDLVQKRSVASLSEMAAGAAHEINNPLAIISGRAQRLLADEENEKRAEMCRSIIAQADRVSDIISELRQFAVPPTPQPREIDPVALAEAAVEAVQGQAGEATVVRVEAPPHAPAIRVDPDQVRDALVEVLRNALEATAEGGTVTVLVQPVAAEEVVRLLVIDDGPGMAPQDRARAFDPFYSRQEAGRHRGLGLPRAFRAVELSGGRMALESKPGHGTTVRLTFPSAKTEETGKAGRG